MNQVRPDRFNAFLDSDGPMIEPVAGGPLSQMTLAIKDIYDVTGYKTGCGNPQKLAEASPATRTAPTVQVLLDAGAQFIGRTQTDELTFSLNGENAHYPRPINPAAPQRITGGSSSGSAAAVAGGLADMAAGSDTGGSIRAPASYCGLIGLRTSQGAISLEGAMPLAASYDTFGWFARDMELYKKIAALLLPASSTVFGRVLRLSELDNLLAGPAEKAAFESAFQSVERVVGTSRPATLTAMDIDQRYWCFRKTQSYEAWQYHGPWISAAERHLGPGVGERFAYGSTIDDQSYHAEMEKRAELTDELHQLLADDGLIIMPTVPGAAPEAKAPFETVQAYREQALRLLCHCGLSGLPELTLPLSSVQGAPFGLSLLGPRGSDRALLALGNRILQASSANNANGTV